MTVRLALLAVLAALALPLPASARDHDRDHDHDRARDLYERGEIHSLRDIMQAVAARLQGDVVAVDLVPVGERWVYRFQVVTADGRRTTVDVDADLALPSTHEAP